MKNFIFIVVLAFFSLSINIRAQVNVSVNHSNIDSTLITNLRKCIDISMSDVVDISNTYIDSSKYTIIKGRKVYHKISLSKGIRPDSLVNLFKHLVRDQKYKVYGYIFDYLFLNGLDFNYDYYTQFLFIEESASYLDRFQSKEYFENKRLLYYFFDIYKNYRVFIASDISFDSDGINFINNLIKFGDFKYPISCKNVLMNKGVLTRSSFERKFGN